MISCELLAEPAVRPGPLKGPSFRLTPSPAQSISDRVCSGICLSLIEREVFLFFRAWGNFGFADPDSQVGFAYVANLNGLYLMDPRQNALRFAMYRCLGEMDPALMGEEAKGVR